MNMVEPAPTQVTYLIAVGAAVRFVTAPLERVRCILQTGGIDGKGDEKTGIFEVINMLLNRRPYWCLWRGTGYSIALLMCEEWLKVATTPVYSLAIRCTALHPFEITRTFLLSDSCSGSFTRPRFLFQSDFFIIHCVQQLILFSLKSTVSSWVQSCSEIPVAFRPLAVSILLSFISQPFDVVKRRLLMHACLPHNKIMKSCKITFTDLFRGLFTNTVKLLCSTAVVSICGVVHRKWSPVRISDEVIEDVCPLTEWLTMKTTSMKEQAMLYIKTSGLPFAS
eukprot:TRINITY_DN25554_c0_g1_i1.p1 TRINITY_DN25554_c0_g1~~TRINITY_DN25554_c0_g1_i1.p1  ORF type:complete len:280 (+),score=17.16 TRINITY_DN25554_c0_g1_i1:77-916(+)